MSSKAEVTAAAPAPTEAGEHEALAQRLLDEGAPEYEVLAYLITAFRMRERGLRGPITPDLVKVCEPLADFLVANGFHRRPPVDEAGPVEAGERELTPCGNIVCTGCRVCGCPALWVAPEAEAGEREALAVARNIINQIGDLWYERIPSSEWVKVRQETNDELDRFVAGLIQSFRRAPIEDTEPPEADATPDEAYELGRVAGYDEAMREVTGDAEPVAYEVRSWYEVITHDGATVIVYVMADGSIYGPDHAMTLGEFATAVAHNRAHRLVRADAAPIEVTDEAVAAGARALNPEAWSAYDQSDHVMRRVMVQHTLNTARPVIEAAFKEINR